MNCTLKSGIVFSVLLNLLLAGIIVGDVGNYVVKAPKGYTWEEIGLALPADAQPQFEKTIAQAERDNGEIRQKISDARKKLLTLIKTEPFDKAACLTQMQQVKQLRIQMMERMITAVSQFAEKLSPQERITLADMLRNPPRPSHIEHAE